MPSLRLPLVPGWNPIRVPCVSSKKRKRKPKEKMMDPMHEANVDALLGDVTKMLKANCVKLYKSGGIDIEKYETCGFALAKILLAASMEQCQNRFHPLSDEFREDLRNLLHF